MKISAIAAIGKNNEIGLNNKLIWKISEDLKNFKKITMGHFLVMGRKTYESIGKNLEGRKLIILTSDPYYKAGEHITAQGIDEAIFYARKHGEDELMICGGEKVYRDFYSRCDQMYISRVDFEGEADTFFPQINMDDWKIDREEFFPSKDDDTPSWTFQVLTRKS